MKEHEFNSEHKAEDKPPQLRFVHAKMEDRRMTEANGKYSERNVIKVYTRAWGDVKAEVPNIVKGFAYDEKTVPTEVTRYVTKMVQVEDGDGNTSYEQKTVKQTDIVDKKEYIFKETTPWFDQLEQKLKHGKISKNYYDYCLRAFKQWEQTGEVPVDGTPLIEWTLISEGLKSKFLELGINTVERLAEISEEVLLSAGMGARDAKKKAEAFVKSGTDLNKASIQISHLQERLSESDRQAQEREAQLSDMERKVKELEEKIAKRKPGRPPKEKAA